MRSRFSLFLIFVSVYSSANENWRIDESKIERIKSRILTEDEKEYWASVYKDVWKPYRICVNEWKEKAKSGGFEISEEMSPHFRCQHYVPNESEFYTLVKKSNT